MARDFAGDSPLVVVLGDNIFEYAQSDAHRGVVVPARTVRRSSSRSVPDPENFGVVVYGEDGQVADIVEKAGVVDTRYPEPPTSLAVVGLYCYPPGRLRRHRVASSLEPGGARDHRRQPSLRARGPPSGSRGRGLVGGRGQALAAPRRDRGRDRGDGSEQGLAVIAGIQRFPLRFHADDRGWFAELRRDSVLPKPMVQTNLSFSRAGVVRGLHFHERGQDDLFACLRGNGADRRARPGHGRDVHRGHRGRQSGRDLHSGPPRARLRGVDGHPLLLPRDRRVRPGRPGRAHGRVERPASRAPVEHGRSPILSARDATDSS